jgi:hypothetical protein
MELKERHQVLAYKDTSVDKEIVNELILRAIKRMPSKQRRRRVNITLIDTSIGKRKELIYRTTLPVDPPEGYNPQILAPWVLAFGAREEAWDKEDVDYKWFLQEMGVEIGFIAGYISLHAPELGLGTGFCACIHDRFELYKILGYHPMLFLGLGVEDPDATEFYCYRDKKMMPIPYQVRESRESEPDIEEFYKVI